MEFRDGVLYFNPQIPESLYELTMRIKYRGRWFYINITPDKLAITAGRHKDGTAKIGFRGAVYEIMAGDTLKFDIR
jgi:trehalose/maltose hydrolase-like predicted phosphorylase